MEVRTKTITLVFLPSLVDERQCDLLVKGQGRSASYGPCMITKKKVEMSFFPQSISIQVGPGAHFVAVPTCKEKSRVERERERHTLHRFFSSPFKLIHLPD